jgi:hypothetical protein
MSSTDNKVEEMRCNVNEIKDYADVILSQSITISKLQSVAETARAGIDMLTKKNHSQSEIIASLKSERDSAVKKLQTLEDSQHDEGLLEEMSSKLDDLETAVLEKISSKLNDLEAGVLEEMSRKIDDLWEESKKRRT